MVSNDEVIAPLNLKAWGERNDIQVMTPKDFPDRNSFRDAVFDITLTGDLFPPRSVGTVVVCAAAPAV